MCLGQALGPSRKPLLARGGEEGHTFARRFQPGASRVDKADSEQGACPPLPAPRGQLVDSRAGWVGEGIAKEKTPQWEPKT